MPSIVLNALRIDEVGTALRGVNALTDGMCSTPCGIDEVGTLESRSHEFDKLVCSTPCGIDEVGTVDLDHIAVD